MRIKAKRVTLNDKRIKKNLNKSAENNSRSGMMIMDIFFRDERGNQMKFLFSIFARRGFCYPQHICRGLWPQF